jgi:DUF4097 and DUF4098 domain-containing protein YvlB
MSKRRFETGHSPQVTISECHGNLSISGGQEAMVSVSGHDFQVTESEKGVSIESRGSLAVRVPHGASLVLQTIHDHLSIKGVVGDIHLADMRGNVLMKNVGNVVVDTVQGDVMAKNVDGTFSLEQGHHDVALRNSGDLTIGLVRGDIAARYVNGTVTVNEVMGDVSLRTVNGDVAIHHSRRDANLRNLGGINVVEKVAGDIRLVGGLAAGKHTFKAQGDIVVIWPVDEPLSLTATAAKIRNRLDLADISETEGSLTGRIGDGETHLILEAAGHIILKPGRREGDSFMNIDIDDSGFEFGFSFGDLGEKITREMDSRLAEVAARFEKGWGPDLAHKVEARAQAAAKRAEEAAEKAMRRAEQAMKQARWQGERRVWAPPPPSTPAAPGAKEKKATDEERLKILSMVEKGIISPEEASTLLDALG